MMREHFPRISVTFGDAIINMTPAAVRQWVTSSLSPQASALQGVSPASPALSSVPTASSATVTPITAAALLQHSSQMSVTSTPSASTDIRKLVAEHICRYLNRNYRNRFPEPDDFRHYCRKLTHNFIDSYASVEPGAIAELTHHYVDQAMHNDPGAIYASESVRRKMGRKD